MWDIVVSGIIVAAGLVPIVRFVEGCGKLYREAFLEYYTHGSSGRVAYTSRYGRQSEIQAIANEYLKRRDPSGRPSVKIDSKSDKNKRNSPKTAL